ncbi:MAG: hypothetical protein H0W39_00880 [Sphingomonas sp.]|nr:hypothetical protein [Sphingomonas sp.]
MNARAFAASCGCPTNDPALLSIYEDIRQYGIREARAGHYERVKLVKKLKVHPSMFFAMIRPALSSDEAIEDAARFISCFRNLPRWQQESRLDRLAKAKQVLVMARFFRRYGLRIWARRAA